jgi:RimJ/RimL family protein N-acetyltransferase
VTRLVAYAADDLPVLAALNAPELMTFLGGPESDEKLRKRHERYVAAAGSAATHVFTIREDGGTRVGSIVFWERTWREQQVYETGWAVLTKFQGRGFATAATRLVIERARAERRLHELHAFPKVINEASNAICRKAGFTLLGECDFEYPPGTPIRCNDWYVELW